MLAAQAGEIPRTIRAKNALCGYYESGTLPRLSLPQGIPKQRQAPTKQEGTEVRHQGREWEFGRNGNDREATSRKLRLWSNPSTKNKKGAIRERERDREKSARMCRIRSTCSGPFGSCLARTLMNRDAYERLSKKWFHWEKRPRAKRTARFIKIIHTFRQSSPLVTSFLYFWKKYFACSLTPRSRIII